MTATKQATPQPNEFSVRPAYIHEIEIADVDLAYTVDIRGSSDINRFTVMWCGWGWACTCKGHSLKPCAHVQALQRFLLEKEGAKDAQQLMKSKAKFFSQELFHLAHQLGCDYHAVLAAVVTEATEAHSRKQRNKESLLKVGAAEGDFNV